MAEIRNKAGQFVAGWRGGPGRPLGARSKFSELAIAALGADFAEHGASVIEEVRKTKPHHYLSIVASLLPRQLSVERASPFADLTDEEMMQLEELLSAMRAKTVRKLEQHNGTQNGAANFPGASRPDGDS